MDPIHIRRAHEALIHKVNREAICICIKYSVKIEPMYFEWDLFISSLEKNIPDILQEILDQRHNSEQGPSQSVPTDSGDNNMDLRHDHTDRQHRQRPPILRLSWPRARGQSQHHGSFCYSIPEMSYNCITMVTTPTWLMTQSTGPGMCHTPLQLSQQVNHLNTMAMQTGQCYSQNTWLIMTLMILLFMKIDIKKCIIPNYPPMVKWKHPLTSYDL